MITPYEARKHIDRMGVPCGQNVPLPDDVDVSECQEFFGTRCSNNVHMKGRRLAHVDRADPRTDPIGHLKKDVGVPYALIGSAVGAILGAVLMKGDRKAGAALGSMAGGLLGSIADNVADRNSAQARQHEDQYI